MQIRLHRIQEIFAIYRTKITHEMISPATKLKINKLIIAEHEFQLSNMLVIGLPNHPFHK